MTVNGDLVDAYTSYVTGAVNAWLPLISMVIGIFLSFAILNLIRHFILKAGK